VQVWATPIAFRERLQPLLGIYAQDQWKIKHLTLNVGVRADYVNVYVPEQHLAAGRFVPVRDFAPVYNVPNWKDVSPRLGASYDLFGNGKTALKGSLGRFMVTTGAVTLGRIANPVQASVLNATRAWQDVNGDFIPQEGELGPVSPSTFGTVNITTRYDDNYKEGYGKRADNWEASASIQHELVPGMSVSAGYFRRWYGHFPVTDNLAQTPADFSPYCVTAPVDPRLPGGGGQPICGFYDVSETKFGKVDNLITFADHFGTQQEVYDGVDLTFDARLPKGVVVSGGLNTGRTRTDRCFVVDSPQELLYCKVAPPFRTQVKFFGVYPLPWWGLQTSATLQSLPGPEITAPYAATNTDIKSTLGRNLAGSVSAVLVDLIPPGTRYAERLNQVDFRLTKGFNVGRGRIQGMFDIYNLFNVSPVVVLNPRYSPTSTWPTPAVILLGRLFKFNVQVDF
jgi:hypothetical protein